jgi:hypothetical protein
VDPASKAGKSIMLVLVVLGALFLIAALVFLVLKINRLKGTERTDAVIIDKWEGSTTISYKVDGTIYEYRFPESSSNERIGDTITVAYNKNAPDHPYRTGFTAYFVSVMFAFFGFGCSFLGWNGLRTFHRKPKKEQVPWELP